MKNLFFLLLIFSSYYSFAQDIIEQSYNSLKIDTSTLKQAYTTNNIDSQINIQSNNKNLSFPACSPGTSNPNCATNTPLTIGAPCITGTTCSGSLPSLSGTCLSGALECSVYSFVATSTNMYVLITFNSSSGCHIRSTVHSATGSCVGTQISCQTGAPLDDLHSFTTLIIGNTYYVQVCYLPGGACGNNGNATYCINVDESDIPCNTCIDSCGTAAGYATNPTVPQVVADCQTEPFSPSLQPGSLNTFCYDFTATNTSVDFNVIITSNCGGGNVTNFSWALYDITCGIPIQTGNLSNLTFTPVIIGNDYVFCYTFNVPATCSHSQHCPYFVGATPILLDFDLIKFVGTYQNKEVFLNWSLNSNNKLVNVEKSYNGINFESLINYVKDSAIDKNPYSDVSYYRLKQDDTYSNTIAVSTDSYDTDKFQIYNTYPQPFSELLTLDFNPGNSTSVNIEIIDLLGRVVFNEIYKVIPKSRNYVELHLEKLNVGIYNVLLEETVTKRVLSTLNFKNK